MEAESCMCSGVGFLVIISFIIGVVANWVWLADPRDKPQWKQVVFLNLLGIVGYIVFMVIYCTIQSLKWFWSLLGKEWFPEDNDKNIKK